MSDEAPVYLIWSHEHSLWWGPGGNGYTPRIADAGRYTRDGALDICIRAMPGAEHALNELPVRLDDLMMMLDAYRDLYAGRTEKWQ